MNAKQLSLAALVALAMVGTGCKKAAEPAPAPAPAPAAAAATVSVVDVNLGTSLNADKTIAAAAMTFKPTDTIYASVKTAGSAAAATLAAKWTFEDGQTVHEESLSIAPTGPAVTEFHIGKPDGWPVGKYKVAVSVNGVEGVSKGFEVR